MCLFTHVSLSLATHLDVDQRAAILATQSQALTEAQDGQEDGGGLQVNRHTHSCPWYHPAADKSKD